MDGDGEEGNGEGGGTFHALDGHVWVKVFMSAESLEEGKGPACRWQYDHFPKTKNSIL